MLDENGSRPSISGNQVKISMANGFYWCVMASDMAYVFTNAKKRCL